MEKHTNIPIFIPHLGCPNNCVFCNQRKISGTVCFDKENVRGDIDAFLETAAAKKGELQLAYFGGSFTAIDRGDMLYLLRLGYEYVKAGKIASIRCSTRPDAIDAEILSILREYGVGSIELGIQSLSDRVLDASGRGHDAETSLEACRLIKEFGCFELVGQMMVALPASTPEDEVMTARLICDAGADGARIYPTMVFAKTELDAMRLRGEYTPPPLDELVERSADVFSVFASRGVNVIRIGLMEGETLHDPDGISAGAYHPAMGELVLSRYYLGLMKKELDILPRGGNITVYCAKGETSKVIGHGKRNKIKIQNEYNVKNIKVIEKDCIMMYNIKIMH